MIGPILLALSWLLLRLEGQGIAAIGVNAPAVRARQLAAGFIVGGLVDMVLPKLFVASVSWYLTRGSPRDGSPDSAPAPARSAA